MRFFAGLMIIEALDEASLRSALRQAAEMLPTCLAASASRDLSGHVALDARIASVE